MRSVPRSLELATLGFFILLTACPYDLLLHSACLVLLVLVVVVATAYVVPLETHQRPHVNVPTSKLGQAEDRALNFVKLHISFTSAQA